MKAYGGKSKGGDGVQLQEISGNEKQNAANNIEAIQKYLEEKDGINYKAMLPGQAEAIEEKYYERAKKVYNLTWNEKVDFNKAVDKAEENDKKREEGGRTPDENSRRREQ